MSKKLSFLIPVYNPPEELFRACLDSCLKQEGVNIEIVAVNDGSKNNALDILHEYDQKFPGIFKIINQENKGIGPTRNECLRHATGDYIWFMDSDDRVRPDSAKILVDAIEKYDADQVIFPFLIKDISENMEFPAWTEKKFEVISKEYAFANFFRSFWRRVIKKSLIDKVNIQVPNSSMHEDWPVTLRWMLESDKIIYTTAHQYIYVQNKGSITHQKFYSPEFFKSYMSILELLDENAEKFPKYKPWMVLNEFISIKTNIDSRLMKSINAPEAQSPEIQKQYQELEEILEHWLDKYTQEDKALVYLYQSAQSQYKNKYSKVKSDLDKIRNSLIWRSTKPFRQTMNYLYKKFIQKK